MRHYAFPLSVYLWTYPFTIFTGILPSDYTSLGFAHTTVKMAGMISLKMQIYPDKIDMLRNYLRTTQSSCLQMGDFFHKKHWMNIVNCTQLNPAVWEYTKLTHTPALNICQLPQLHNETQAAILLAPASISKLQLFFFKAKYHTYADIYTFLSHL